MSSSITPPPGWTVTAFLGAIFAGIVCGFAAPQARAEANPPPALVKSPPHGVVVDADGLPVADCLLWLRYEADSHFLDHRSKTVGIAKSDAQGRFQFKESMPFATLHGSLEGERYIILARRDGLGIGWDWIAGADPDHAPVTLRLVPASPLEVHVLDSKRQPVPDATVWLSSVSPSNPNQDGNPWLTEPTGWLQATSNAGGRAFLEVPEKTWTISVKGPESGPAYATRLAHPQRVNDNVSTAAPLEIIMSLASQLSGVVVDDQGNPIPDMPILIERADDGHGYYLDHRRYVTDATGRFHINDLRPYARSGASGWRVWATGTDWTSEPLTLPLRPGQHHENLRIEAVRGKLVRGTTIDSINKRPIAGARITVYPKRNGKYPCRDHAWSDKDGNFVKRVPFGDTKFSFTNLPAGSCTVSFSFGGTWSVHGDKVEEEISLNTREPLHRLVKVAGYVEPPLPDVRVNATLAPGAALGQGHKLEGTTRDRYLHGSAPSASTDAQGRFEVMDWPGDTSVLVFGRTKDRSRAGWTKVETAGGLVMPEPIRMHKTASVRVRVTGAEDKPLSSVELDVFPVVDEQWLAFDPNVTTDDMGLAVLKGVLPGLTYQIRDSNDTSRSHHLVLLPKKPADGVIPTVDVPLLRPKEMPFLVQVLDRAGRPVRLESIIELEATFNKQPGSTRSFISSYHKVQIKERKPDGTHVLSSDERIDAYAVAAPFEVFGKLADGTFVSAKGTMEAGSRHVPVTVEQLVPLVRPPVIPLDGVAPDEIAGQVVDPAGKPVGGAAVTFLSWGRHDLGIVTTGADGVFRGKLDLGTEGGKNVVYTKDPTRSKKWKDDRTGSMAWDETNHPFEMVRVEKEGFATAWVINGKPGEPFEAKLDNTTRLKGVFTGPDGKPLRDVVAVLITSHGSFRQWPGQPPQTQPFTQHLPLVRTSPDGAYDWLVAPGIYTIELRSRDGMCALVKLLEVKSGSTLLIPAHFSPGRDFRIRVTNADGKALPGARVNWLEYDGGTSDILGDVSPSQTTDADGWATWQGLPPWKGRFAISNTKFKRCLDDAGFTGWHDANAATPVGEHPSDRSPLLMFDLTKISETTIRVVPE